MTKSLLYSTTKGGERMAKQEVPQEITQDFMIDYCVKNNQVGWLKEQVQKTYVDSNGKTRKVSWVQVRKEFKAKFFPKETNSDFYTRVMQL